MPTYIEETNKGRTLHLFNLGELGDGVVAYLDASKLIKDAEREDVANGYKSGGPKKGCEIEHARMYAGYVGKHATADTLHLFYCNDYYLFTDRQ